MGRQLAGARANRLPVPFVFVLTHSSAVAWMKAVTRAFRHYSSPLADKTRRMLYPEACTFFTRLVEDGYQPNVLIDVLPDQRLVYVCVPKCASSRIKKTLSSLLGRRIQSSEEAYQRHHSGLKSPSRVQILYALNNTAACPSAH
jgi:hypothetical protein